MPPPPLPEGDKSTKGDRILTPQHHLPADIERTSFHIITEELEMMGMTPPPEHEAVVKRVIHTTADFDYARNLHFTPRAVEQAVKALHAGAVIVTDTNMALAGIVSHIPADEVIDAMAEVGSVMSATLRETAEGGLAATPTGQRLAKRLQHK